MNATQVIAHYKVLIAENDLTITLPTSIAVRAGLSEGDWVELASLGKDDRLQPADAEFSEQMAVAERVMSENRGLMRRLADS